MKISRHRWGNPDRTGNLSGNRTEAKNFWRLFFLYWKRGAIVNAFDIIGPIMVGPSSSHTAGAVRIGQMARNLLGEEVKEVLLQFHGSFASTYKGHGTDRAVVGGLIGYAPDDARIKNSLVAAVKIGLSVKIETVNLREAHPNTVVITMWGYSGQILSITGSSIGGGNIVIKQINNLEVEIYGEYHTLVIVHQDISGMVANVTGLLAQNDINIARMYLSRSRRGGEALMVIEVDQKPAQSVIKCIAERERIISVRYLKPVS